MAQIPGYEPAQPSAEHSDLLVVANLKTVRDSNTKVPRHAAFTLTELVIVLAILSVLASLLVTTALKNSRQIKRAQCAANLQQFGLATQIYGNDYNGRLPPVPSGNWAWDSPATFTAFVESTGCKWSTMFCPGTSPFFTESDNLQLYNLASSYRIIGYATTFSGTATLLSSNVNTSLNPSPIQVGPFTFVTPLPAERELLADGTISDFNQINPALRYSSTYRYIGIAGGFIKPHLSPHLSGRFPMGGNVAMLDGRVTWRQFKDMQPRTAGFAPGFWW
jgi:prepilin-type N-terminal cleavage/methylation domain-containing protein